jgi:hypothetical protein
VDAPVRGGATADPAERLPGATARERRRLGSLLARPWVIVALVAFVCLLGVAFLLGVPAITRQSATGSQTPSATSPTTKDASPARRTTPARPAPAHRVCVDPPPGAPPNTLYIMDGVELCADRSPAGKYTIGADTSSQRRDWLTRSGDALKMAYPPGQAWGAVFLTVGDPIPPGSRPGQDLSHCHTLQVDLRTDTDGATLSIGMKDKDQPDDGTEPKIRVTPTKTWATKTFRLTNLTGIKLSAVYVVIEFVFEPNDPPQIVYFRNVRLLCPGFRSSGAA